MAALRAVGQRSTRLALSATPRANGCRIPSSLEASGPSVRSLHTTTEDTMGFLDRLFGTAVKSKKAFPEKYGVVGDYMPDGFVNQQRFPFRRQQN